MTKKELAAMIDHTALKATTTPTDIEKLCREALEYQFASVCVNPCYCKQAASLLKDSNVKVCTVIGFPLGANTTKLKGIETALAIEDGAKEIDMVINIGAAKAANWEIVEKDIQEVVKAAGGKAIIKVIIECCYLTKDEIKTITKIIDYTNADYIKTSTGFGTGGALAEDIKLMKDESSQLKIKAAGGIRDLNTTLAMIKAGADRIGASSGIAILKELIS